MNSTVYAELAAVVDHARQHQNMSIQDVAEAAQIDPATVRRLLDGDQVRMSSVRTVLGALDLEWNLVVHTLAHRSRVPTTS